MQTAGSLKSCWESKWCARRQSRELVLCLIGAGGSPNVLDAGYCWVRNYVSLRPGCPDVAVDHSDISVSV